MVGNSVRYWSIALVLTMPLATVLCGGPELHAQSVAANTPSTSVSNTRTVSVNADKALLVNVLQNIAQQAGLTPFYSADVKNSKVRVTLHLENVPVVDAFQQALRGTGLKANIEARVVAFGSDAETAVAQGGVVGKVIDAKTRKGLHGAIVTLDDASKGVASADDGTFRFPSVAPGEHTIRVRMIGYAKAAKVTTVVEGQTVSVEIALETSVSTLDQIIVTGTVVETERRAIPNAVTVITAKDIEQRGITKIDQLFRGDVAGLFSMNYGSGATVDQVTMFSRGATSLMSLSNVAPTPIKTYVDGVEMADAHYLSSIDPKSIDRIEILTGPQASTIYGSNAINGVMQIFTKRGATPKPQLTATLLSGLVQNNFSTSYTPQHDYSAQLSGTEGHWSYNVGGSWVYVGPWTPSKQLATLNGFGGARIQFGSMTVDASLRRTQKTSRLKGNGATQLTNERRADGTYGVEPFYISDRPFTYVLDGQTVGLTLSYAPVSWWTNEAVIGNDVSDYDYAQTTRTFGSPSDTIMLLSQSHAGRTSLRYTSTASVGISSMMHATLTFGADSWKGTTEFLRVNAGQTTGTLSALATTVQRQPDHDAGAFIQSQVGLWDALFFTYGVRAEWNPNYGDESNPNYAPRYGVAYTTDVGQLTTKLRFSYGRSTRPPSTNLKSPIYYDDNTYGHWNARRESPELGPEYQQGGEGGLELYLGSRASLVVTRYNQTVDGLIGQPVIDSVQSLVPGSSGYTYRTVTQSLNIGSIRNTGWELQGTINTGPLSTRGTYSWSKSRVIGLTPAYANLPQGLAGTYTPGASLQGLPEHTWALGVTYAHAATTLSLNVNGVGQIYQFNDDFLFSVFNARLNADKARMSRPVTYQAIGAGYVMADLNASRRFTSNVDGIFQVQNLTDMYQDDFGNGYATIGRQTKMGVRLRF